MSMDLEKHFPTSSSNEENFETAQNCQGDFNELKSKVSTLESQLSERNIELETVKLENSQL